MRWLPIALLALAACDAPTSGALPIDAATAAGDGSSLDAPASDAPASRPDAGPTPDALTLPELDAWIQMQMDRLHIPGLQAVMVKNGRVAWSGAYGYADAARTVPVTDVTLFMLASVSKTVMAAAVMQLVEAGRFALDDDVASNLPFSLRNPSYAQTAITYRMLLTHTSSAADDWSVITSHAVTGGDSPIALSDWERGYFTPGGGYNQGNAWSSSRPGNAYDYANEGSAMLGLLVERAGGQPFDQYCREHLFQPLGMTETSYRLADLDVAHVAMPQEWTGGGFSATGHPGHPEYPVVTLRTSARQLARYLIAFIGGGSIDGEGTRILQTATVDEMKRVQFPNLAPGQGLIWRHETLGGADTIGHDGADTGVSTIMVFRPSDGAGAIVLTNGEASVSSLATHLLSIASTL